MIFSLISVFVRAANKPNEGIRDDGQWHFRTLTSSYPQSQFSDQLSMPQWLRVNDTISLTMLAINPKHTAPCEISILQNDDGRILKTMRPKRVFKPYNSAVFRGHLDGRQLVPMDSSAAWYFKGLPEENLQKYLKEPLVRGDGETDTNRKHPTNYNLAVQQFTMILPEEQLSAAIRDGGKNGSPLLVTVELSCPRWKRYRFVTQIVSATQDLQQSKSQPIRQRRLLQKATESSLLPPLNELPVQTFDYNERGQVFHPRLPIMNEQVFGVNYDPLFDSLPVGRNTHLTGEWNPITQPFIQLSFSQMRPWMNHALGIRVSLRQVGDSRFKHRLVTIYYDHIPWCTHHQDLPACKRRKNRCDPSSLSTETNLKCTRDIEQLLEGFEQEPPKELKNVCLMDQTLLFKEITASSFMHRSEGWVLPWLNMPASSRIKGMIYSIRLWARLNETVASKILQPGALYYWQFENMAAFNDRPLESAWSFVANLFDPRRVSTNPFRLIAVPEPENAPQNDLGDDDGGEDNIGDNGEDNGEDNVVKDDGNGAGDGEDVGETEGVE